MNDIEKYCCLCGMDMEKDKNTSKQFWFSIGSVIRCYCSKCGDLGQSVMDEYLKLRSRKDRAREYYDEYDLVKMVEALHKNKNGNIKISFDNHNGYSEDVVNAPILKNDKPIGFITSVTPEKVEGLIWEKYAPITEVSDYASNIVGFEFIY